jgi:hydrogenase expression/formation protein HypE
LPVQEFWDILVAIRYACKQAGVQVVTGDTKVVERGKGDKVFINTTGVGQLHPQAAIDVDRVKSGDRIIVSDQIATHGVAILSVREGLEFETTIESDTRNLNHAVFALLDDFGDQVRLLRDPTRGGLATVLNEITRDTCLGIDLTERSIPMDEQVAGACEMLGLDPLYVANEGVFIAVVDPIVAAAAVDLLRSREECRHAAVIGAVTDDHPGQVVLTSSIGGRRVVNMLVGEQLPRIC